MYSAYKNIFQTANTTISKYNVKDGEVTSTNMWQQFIQHLQKLATCKVQLLLQS